jgi:hypothetical protein
VQPEGSIPAGILYFLAERYLPVMSDWVDVSEIAGALGLPIEEVERYTAELQEHALIETAPPDEEHASAAAIITVKGLLAIGRLP